MKTILLPILISPLVALAALAESPFREGIKEPITPDQEPNLAAKKRVTKDILDAFGELELGSTGQNPQCYRIFIQLESLKPILLKYFIPSLDRKQPELEIKQISQKNNQWELDFHKNLKISNEIYSLLKNLFELSDPMRLPSKDWDLNDSLGGTCWVYEFCVPDGFIIFSRRNPLGFGLEDTFSATGVSKERLARELHLSSFVLMLCTVAEIEIDFGRLR